MCQMARHAAALVTHSQARTSHQSFSAVCMMTVPPGNEDFWAVWGIPEVLALLEPDRSADAVVRRDASAAAGLLSERGACTSRLQRWLTACSDAHMQHALTSPVLAHSPLLHSPAYCLRVQGCGSPPPSLPCHLHHTVCAALLQGRSRLQRGGHTRVPGALAHS